MVGMLKNNSNTIQVIVGYIKHPLAWRWYNWHTLNTTTVWCQRSTAAPYLGHGVPCCLVEAAFYCQLVVVLCIFMFSFLLLAHIKTIYRIVSVHHVLHTYAITLKIYTTSISLNVSALILRYNPNEVFLNMYACMHARLSQLDEMIQLFKIRKEI